MQMLMKSTLFAVVMTVLGAALAVAPAHAQSDSRVLVTIPCDFSVGNTQLKAGRYTVQELQSGVLAFSSKDGQENLFALIVRGDSPNRGHQPRFVFMRYGSEAFLNKVFLSADNDYDQLRLSSRERELMQVRASGEELSLLAQPAR